MCKSEPHDGNRCTKRFKGIEGFLKRIAYNLGNSPSQTEVKIISCIPIDVTDLQQKIMVLEKELQEKSCKRVNTALCESVQLETTNNVGLCNIISVNRSTTMPDSMAELVESFSNPSMSTLVTSNLLRSASHVESVTPGDINQQKYRKNLYRKKKKDIRSDKSKTQSVYYSQINANPFDKSPFNKSPFDEFSLSNKPVVHPHAFYMIGNKYKPKALGDDSSGITAFSSPICRDIQEFSMSTPASDICSCCHGAFQNIDHQIIKLNKVFKSSQLVNKGEYYDSSLYDTVPVKEKAARLRQTIDMPKKRETKPTAAVSCWPEDLRTKLNTFSTYTAKVKCNSLSDNEAKPPKINRKQFLIKAIKRRTEASNMGKQIGTETSKSCLVDVGTIYQKANNKPTQVDKCLEATCELRNTNAVCLITGLNNNECQTTTPDESSDDTLKTKDTLNEIKSILQTFLHEIKVASVAKTSADEKPQKDPPVTERYIPESTLQNNVHNSHPGQTADILSDNLTSRQPANKTVGSPGNILGTRSANLVHDNILGMPANFAGHMQDTYIDGIRQNMMGNVGESNMYNVHANMTEAIPTNITDPRAINNCYSFNMNPYIQPYMPSCSKQLDYSQIHYPMKYVQKMPVLYQRQGRPTCNTCFRTNSQVKTLKQETTTATNTDNTKDNRSKETENLIKEIYKSLALTVGVVDKGNVLKKDEEPSDKKITNVVQAVSELLTGQDVSRSSESQNSTTDNSNTQLVSTSETDAVEYKKESVQKLFYRQPEYVPPKNWQSISTASEETLTSASSSETETVLTAVHQPRIHVLQKESKHKKSFFSKMWNKPIQLLKQIEIKRKGKEDKEESLYLEESSSDPEDYQTVYRQKIIQNVPKPARQHLMRLRSHSKYEPEYPTEIVPEKKNRKNTPYLEQEYRRHWNEKLMFNDQYYENSEPEERYIGEEYRRADARAAYYPVQEPRGPFVEARRNLRRVEQVVVKRVPGAKHYKGYE